MIAGLGALQGIEVRELPDVDRPVVTVRAYFDGASPETMDAEVTSVIEGAVARVSGVKTINAASEENNARIRAEFSPNADLDTAANDIREAVAAIERDLPEGVNEITIVKADADTLPIIRLALVSDKLSQEALTRLAEEDVSAELTAIRRCQRSSCSATKNRSCGSWSIRCDWRASGSLSMTSHGCFRAPVSTCQPAASNQTSSY